MYKLLQECEKNKDLIRRQEVEWRSKLSNEIMPQPLRRMFEGIHKCAMEGQFCFSLKNVLYKIPIQEDPIVLSFLALLSRETIDSSRYLLCVRRLACASIGDYRFCHRESSIEDYVVYTMPS